MELFIYFKVVPLGLRYILGEVSRSWIRTKVCLCVDPDKRNTVNTTDGNITIMLDQIPTLGMFVSVGHCLDPWQTGPCFPCTCVCISVFGDNATSKQSHRSHCRPVALLLADCTCFCVCQNWAKMVSSCPISGKSRMKDYGEV